MRATRPVVACLTAVLMATACSTVLESDERAWCSEHAQEVVAASYVAGGPLTLSEVLREAQADVPSPEYFRACRAAFQDR